MDARARKFGLVAAIALLVGSAAAIYAARGPAILLDLDPVGRFLCL